jgi:hypothetical protein
MRLQDEHDCMALITKQIIQLQENGGFWTEEMCKKICVKVWIHFIARDTSEKLDTTESAFVSINSSKT